MNFEDVIFAYVKEHPGTSFKKIFSYLNTKSKNSTAAREDSLKSSLCKKLRILKNEGKLHNIGNSWYFVNGKNNMDS